MNRIITLTTDLGVKDYYVGVVKGSILTQNPSVNIVDITHHIKNYDIVQASFVVKNMFDSFPENTIHAIGVNNFQNKRPYFLVIKHQNHYFIGPDNGVFSLIFDEPPTTVYQLPFEQDGPFPLKYIFSKAITHILSGEPLEEIGKKVDKIEERITLRPIISNSQIRGSVIHVDNYENVVLNITKDLFTNIQAGRPFTLHFKRYDPITRLSQQYADVPIGETLCLFNSAGYLEIAINMGRAGSMHNLGIDDTIQIDFDES